MTTSSGGEVAHTPQPVVPEPVGWLVPATSWHRGRPITPINWHLATPVAVYEHPDGTLRLSPPTVEERS